MARPREVSDQEILETARRILVDHGPGVATSVIAAELGVSSAALFHRFGSKRALMIAALLPPPPAWIEELHFDPARGLEEQLLALSEAIQQHGAAMHPQLSVLRNAGIEPKELFRSCEVPPPVMLLEAIRRFFAEAEACAAVRPGDAAARAMALMGAIGFRNFLGHFCGVLAAIDAQVYQAELIRIFCRGVET